MDIVYMDIQLIQVAKRTSFIGQFIHTAGGQSLDKRGVSLFQQAANITLSEYMKIWCNIQVIIYPILFRGEVIIGGHHVAKEYYNLPDKTEEEFFNDKDKRWFRCVLQKRGYSIIQFVFQSVHKLVCNDVGAGQREIEFKMI